ncbi:TROVE domain-containing protein [Deinococcus irradiatisoli]|uniref:TROVE domain-containing protein n=1 Tax=Deinococcus irradiatisoli TaxID=2202254 RepID=A0A2Z3JCP9_9DEIO|nr:TROVE domain-containing protein [Deinococcus irradiatisoli]AWN22812.1 TROVE domain-containing protein [Deinococcus irradiatisoli]
MAHINTPARTPHRTHEGAPAVPQNAEQQLRRLVMANMLWEDQFYIDGKTTAELIRDLIPQLPADKVSQIAVDAREGGKLRHVPLLLVREMARHESHRALVSSTLARVIQRPDELTEFLALYWQDGRQPLTKGVKKGLAEAFGKFNEYSLAKYNRDGKVKLKDALRVSHPKPRDEAQAELWKRLNNDELTTPDTWETQLSAGVDKKATFERLIAENKLGGLALLRNLRNMKQAGVPDSIIREALGRMKTERILPFRFISAARFAPQLEPELEAAMFRSLEGMPKLSGHTILLLDKSGSMQGQVSAKSDLTRYDAAAGLAMLARELCESCEIWTFETGGGSWLSSGGNQVLQVPARRGFVLRDALGQPGGGTMLGDSVRRMNALTHDRLIVFTDEQSSDPVGAPKGKGYMVNVAAYQHGVGFGDWVRVSGFSEQIMAWIQLNEQAQ